MLVSAPWLQLPQLIHLLPIVTWKHSLGKKATSQYIVSFINLHLTHFCVESLNSISVFCSLSYNVIYVFCLHVSLQTCLLQVKN